jgi:SAM-dependent methyltransferase
MLTEKPEPRTIRLRIAVAAFAILVTELALIRWTSGQIRVFAYFTNIILLAAFLGMGLGVLLGHRRPELIHLALPMLAAFALIGAFADRLGLMTIAFPDTAISLWGTDQRPALIQFAVNMAILLAAFWMIALIFLCAGAALGNAFALSPAVTGYSWDLGGSLAGVLLVAGFTGLALPPTVFFVVSALALLWLSPRWTSALAGLVVVAAIQLSIQGATYSAYNRIDVGVQTTGSVVDHLVVVNRDYHQWIRDLRRAAINDSSATAEERQSRIDQRQAYDIPFTINRQRERALVVGAGTGNDVAAALRNGYRQCLSVDIDKQLIQLGRELHPEQPYQDSRAVPVVNDARAFFEQYSGPPFDVICYGLLDSHAMFSAMSTLRLDNYVYTVEGIRAAWRHVAPGGHLSISFSVYAGDWLADRLFWTITEATGKEPIVIDQGIDWGYVYLVPASGVPLDLSGVADLHRVRPKAMQADVRVTRDDWPFLYVRPGVFPLGYVVLLVLVLTTGGIAIRGALDNGTLGSQRRRLDPFMFLLGAGFMLLETRSVTVLSLLFGSTWIVNTAVFAGILAIALAANQLVATGFSVDRRISAGLLIASLIFLVFAPVSSFGQIGLLGRAALGGLACGLPVGMAGLLVSSRLRETDDAVGSLGSNLLGAIVGGSLEYLSMWVGMRGTGLILIAIYSVTAIMALRNAGQRTPLPAFRSH